MEPARQGKPGKEIKKEKEKETESESESEPWTNN
jgi:hypothetical protein